MNIISLFLFLFCRFKDLVLFGDLIPLILFKQYTVFKPTKQKLKIFIISIHNLFILGYPRPHRFLGFTPKTMHTNNKCDKSCKSLKNIKKYLLKVLHIYSICYIVLISFVKVNLLLGETEA